MIAEGHRTGGFEQITTNKHFSAPLTSTAAGARWRPTAQSAIRLMPLLRGSCVSWQQGPGALSPGAPYRVPSPGCSQGQGHSGSLMVGLREDCALSCHVL